MQAIVIGVVISFIIIIVLLCRYAIYLPNCGGEVDAEITSSFGCILGATLTSLWSIVATYIYYATLKVQANALKTSQENNFSQSLNFLIVNFNGALRDISLTIPKCKKYKQSRFVGSLAISYLYLSMKNVYKITNGKMNTLDVVRSIAAEPLSFEPGTHWQYSLCHDVLAGVVEVISGKRFSDYVKENIFEPLDMTNSFYHIFGDDYNRVSEQYFYEPKTHENDIVKLQMSNQKADGCIKKIDKSVSHVFGDEYDSGGAGIISTPQDYIKFIAALANRGVGVNGERIISFGAVELMRTNQLTPELLKDYTWPDLKGYGYGLGVSTMIDRAASGSLGSIGEFGWNGAAGSVTLADPELNLAMVFSQHIVNPRATYFVPRLKNILYSCIR